jgi:N-acetylglucosaminyltransferase
MMFRMDHLLEHTAQTLFWLTLGLPFFWLVAPWVYAQRFHRRAVAAPHQLALPPVDVIVTCFNEDPELLEACCDSLLKQDYGGELSVYLVDDGSSNQDELHAVMERYRDLLDWTVLLLDRNLGKRGAQDTVFYRGSGKILVTLDSDTTLEPDAIAHMAEAFHDPRVAAATGSCLALNRTQNLLTRSIAARYRLLFEQERAAESWFRAVLCCHGAFSAYRRSVLARCWKAYQQQTYRGSPCTTGDDLHLTNLVLAAGHESIYVPLAQAQTRVPETLQEFALQQLRWSRSFYRELSWTMQALRGRSCYLAAEVASRAAFPFLIITGLGVVVAAMLDGGTGSSFGNAELAALLAAVTATVAMLEARTAHAALYGLLYLVLLPVRVKAIATRGASHWETRRSPPAVR